MEKDLVKIAMEAWEAGNIKRAELLLIEAAADGNGHVAHNLGTLYSIGGPGVEAHPAKSLQYYEQALASGFEETVSNDPTWFKKQP